jgi:hypothetical protein
MPRWRIRITTVTGAEVLWRKGGVVHSLAPELGTMWVTNFKPALFQVMPDGAIVPRGADPRAVDIAAVALDPEIGT